MTSFDIDSSIGAHKIWKSHLENLILGIEEDSLNWNSIGDHTQCSLGIWLQDKGQAYACWRHFDLIVDTHRQFHDVARKIVDLHLAGEQSKAEALLNGDFAMFSYVLVNMLTLLRMEVNRL